MHCWNRPDRPVAVLEAQFDFPISRPCGSQFGPQCRHGGQNQNSHCPGRSHALPCVRSRLAGGGGAQLATGPASGGPMINSAIAPVAIARPYHHRPSSRPNAGGVHATYRGNGYSGSGRRAGTGGRIAEPQGRLNWEVKLSFENRNGASPAIQQCIDASTDQIMQSSAGPLAEAACSRRDIQNRRMALRSTPLARSAARRGRYIRLSRAALIAPIR